MITHLKHNDQWHDATPEELAVIDKIVEAKATAHCESYCFCDAKDNLFALQIQECDDTRYVMPVFIRSKVKSLHNTKPMGYYEAVGDAAKPLMEIFHRIPKEG